MQRRQEIYDGMKTAYINQAHPSNLAYRPQFISNDYKEGRKVLTSIEDELLRCDEFKISIAFITMGGLTPMLQTFEQLEKMGIKGQVLTTNYLNFSEPKALDKLSKMRNITLKVFDVNKGNMGLHTKGYIFRDAEIYRVIIGSSNITSAALTKNKEWNTKLISTEEGEVAQKILNEFAMLWNSEYTRDYSEIRTEYNEKYNIIKKQREIAKNEEVVSLKKYRLEPNSMQLGFINGLKEIVEAGSDRALLISSTGTGKTYASAFAIREIGYKKVLFLVHRSQLAIQSKKAYKNIFERSVSMGIVGAGYADYKSDFVFATIQTVNRDRHLKKFDPDEFDIIVLDEAHHSSADVYQKVFNYFKPKLWLGMTATPDTSNDHLTGKNIYEIFDYQIAYEIRLAKAMEEELLCPFHYFGISDISIMDDFDESAPKSMNLSPNDFNRLTADDRVSHIINKAEYFGYSGSRVKGLIFCSWLDEARALSKKLNEKGYRTLALTGESSEEERQDAFERLAMEEGQDNGLEPLDYILSVELLNEGVDIVEINQVIMLRPTKSPVVFVQQLGRGLRKAENKEYVVILDFIGNYKNNFMIPIALSGDRTYNVDNIRKFVISGNNTIPGASTIHFDEVSRQKIFASIDKISGIKAIIRENYYELKNKIGRVPNLSDFYDKEEVDPMLIVKEYKSYYGLIEKVEKESDYDELSEEDKVIIQYLSTTILSGVRPHELLILKTLIRLGELSLGELALIIKETDGYILEKEDLESAVSTLQGRFVSNNKEEDQYSRMNILEHNGKDDFVIGPSFKEKLRKRIFYQEIMDLVNIGLSRYKESYHSESKLRLYQKYSRRDICLLMSCGRDLSSTMYGMKKIEDDVFLFVTYHKQEADDGEVYLEGKPDYADAFEDSSIFLWESQIGRGIDSGYVKDVKDSKRKHLLVKKSDAETSFYYMGQFDVLELKEKVKKDNSGRDRKITKFKMRMHKSVREDILKYLESKIEERG